MIYSVQRNETHSHIHIYIYVTTNVGRIGNCNLVYVYSLWNFIIYFKKRDNIYLNNLIL